MCNRLGTIPACDRLTDRRADRQTSCHGIVRAMHTRRAVKILDGGDRHLEFRKNLNDSELDRHLHHVTKSRNRKLIQGLDS